LGRNYPALLLRWPSAPPESGGPTDDQRDLLLAALDDFGVTAVDDVDGATRYFFPTAEARDRAAAAMPSIDPTAQVECALISDENWAERSQASITAVRVRDLVVAPPWAVPNDGSTVIVIQPSMGFGTAHHESTRLCLGLLQQLPTVKGLRVLDVGTGSGVLAIAARVLGATTVVAADYDPDAIESARENLELNHIESAITLLTLDLAEPSVLAGQQFDLVFANLTGGMLARFATTLAAFPVTGGTLITSGVTLEEDVMVTDALTAAGFLLHARETEREWVGASWTRAGGT
jgi:ribosomal protein L11 methyltransferase